MLATGIHWRSICLSAAAAIWGLAIAISLASVWTRPAPPGQLPGFNTAHNLDANGPFLWVAGMIVAPIVMPVFLRPIIRRLSDAETQIWAMYAACTAALASL